MNHPLLFLLFLFLALPADGQQRYTLRHFDSENGLPINTVKGMEWDERQQLLWIGTEMGVTEWDGQHFRVVEHIRSRVKEMGVWYPHDVATIYVVTDQQRIYNLSHGHVAYEDEQPDILLFLPYIVGRYIDPAPLCKAIAAKKNKQIWPYWVLPLDSAANEALFIKNDAVYLKEGTNYKPIHKAGMAEFFRRGKELMLTDNENIYTYIRTTKRFRKEIVTGLPDSLKSYRFITNVNSDYPVIYASGNLYRLEKQGGGLHAVLLYSGFPASGENVYIIRFLGNTGHIILGDRVTGLYQLQPASVKTVGAFAEKITTAPHVLYAQALINAEQIVVDDRSIITKAGIQPGKSLLAGDKNFHSAGGYIYYNLQDTIFRYDTATQRIYKMRINDGSRWVAFTTTNKRLYAIASFGVYRIDGDSLVTEYQFPRKPDDEQQYHGITTEYKKGIIAIAYNQTLRLYDVANRRMDSLKVTKNVQIRCLYATDSCLFIGTYGEGIYVLKDKQVKTIPPDWLGNLLYAHCIVPDGKGALFISSNNGLYKVSAKAFVHAANHPGPLYYHYFGRQDGLATVELNGSCQDCALRLPDGTLSFPSMNGLAWIHPDSIANRPPPGIVLADSVAVDNKYMDIESAALKTISSNVQHIRFNVTIPYWGSAENMYTWYRLLRDDAGKQDTAWLPFNPRFQQDFSFTALKPDNYKFEIKVLTGFEPGEAKYLSIPFTIMQPWYLQWYGLLLWAILWIGIIILLIKWRTASIRRREITLGQIVAERTTELNAKVMQLGEANHVRERLISVISHNIITPLRYMHRAAGSLRDQQQHLSIETKYKAMTTMKETSRELELLSVNLLNWIKTQHQGHMNNLPTSFLLPDIIQHTLLILQPIASEKNQQIVTQNDCSHPILQYKDALQIILYNLMLNAVLYSVNGTIHVLCAAKKDKIVLVVKDEGVGMPVEKINELLGMHVGKSNNDIPGNDGQGFGYLIIRDSLKIIKGELSIESKIGSGTTIQVSFNSMSTC